MAELDINASTTPTIITDYTVKQEVTDGVGDQKETTYDSPDFTKWYGIYKRIAKVKVPINAYSTWVVGKGWIADNRVTDILDKIRGWGEDSFLSILWNMLVIKKVNGDSFAEIIRNPET